MSRADKERAEKGIVHRSGKLVDEKANRVEEARVKNITKFISGRRIKYDPKVYLAPFCPECGAPEAEMAQRRYGDFECLCRKCYLVWTPGKVEATRISGQEDDGEID